MPRAPAPPVSRRRDSGFSGCRPGREIGDSGLRMHRSAPRRRLSGGAPIPGRRRGRHVALIAGRKEEKWGRRRASMAPVPDSPGDGVPVYEKYRDRDQKNHTGDYSGSWHLSLESRNERMRTVPRARPVLAHFMRGK